MSFATTKLSRAAPYQTPEQRQCGLDTPLMVVRTGGHNVSGEVQATRRRPRGGLLPRVDGRGHARLGEGRDRADRLALSGTGLRQREFPRANPPAKARRGG